MMHLSASDLLFSDYPTRFCRSAARFVHTWSAQFLKLVVQILIQIERFWLDIRLHSIPIPGWCILLYFFYSRIKIDTQAKYSLWICLIGIKIHAYLISTIVKVARMNFDVDQTVLIENRTISEFVLMYFVFCFFYQRIKIQNLTRHLNLSGLL